MTRDEILNLKANRNTNALIAERVMKWQAWTEQRGPYTYFIWQQKGKPEPYYQSRDWEVQKKRYAKIGALEFDPHKHIEAGLRNFTGDISEAWQVVKKVDRPVSIIESAIRDGFWCEFLMDFDKDRVIDAKAETVPLAICRAALLTTLEDK